MGIQDGFNLAVARRAFEAARVEIEEYISKFEKAHQFAQEQFDTKGGKDIALGGNLGTVALNAFEEMNTNPFNELRARLDDFINNKLQTVMQNNMAAEDATRNAYSA